MTDKRKRAAPTIDLTASEVPGAESAKAEGAPAQDTTPPAPEQPKQETKAETSPQEPPPAETPAPPNATKAYLLPLVAGFAGAIVGGALVWALLPASSTEGSRVAALQKQVDELKNRPAANDPAIDELRQSVRKLESDITKLPPTDATVAARLAAADKAMKSLGVALAALNTRSDLIAAQADKAQQSATGAEQAITELRESVQHAAQRASTAADTGQLDALQKRLAALEDSVKTAREQISNASAADKAARLALSAVALRDAVASGGPYQAELAQAKALGAGDKELAPLQPFAANGVPSKVALAQQLRALMPAMLNASGAKTAPAGFLERLEANAGKIVHFSPISVPQGDRPADALARIEVEASRADIEGALADLAKLPEPVRAPAQAWIAKAEAYEQALAASRKLALSATRALGH